MFHSCGNEKAPHSNNSSLWQGNNDEEKRRSQDHRVRQMISTIGDRPPPPPPPPEDIIVHEHQHPKGDKSRFQNALLSFGLPNRLNHTEDTRLLQDGSGLRQIESASTEPMAATFEHEQQHAQRRSGRFPSPRSGLLTELENATTLLAAYWQRDDLHMRQLDVLTERVMEAEAAAAAERNSVLEYQANCTELGRTVALLQDEIEEWTNKCRNLTLQNEKDAARMEKMKDELKERNRKKKKRGFFAWLFGINSREEEDEDKLQSAQEFARSTLLRALQAERDSVNELDNALSILQQNNSAISEMVHSRDMLIDELNNRVAVFEEDKLVLKAALKQLQKEMKEEGPKTQKVIDDLKTARAEVERLNSELTSVLAEHKAEVSLLEDIISQKQASINSSESNMTVIGSYVDKQERLATFALARRDIDLREEKCKEIEERASLLEKECNELREKMSSYDTDHDELKSLLADLVDERAELQRENAALRKREEQPCSGGSRLRDTISSLEIDVDSLAKYVSVWETKVADLESIVENQSSELRQSEEQGKELSRALEENTKLLENIRQQQVRAHEIEPLLQEESADDEQTKELHHVQDDIPPPPPPPPPPANSEDSLIFDVEEDFSPQPNERLEVDSSESFDGQRPPDSELELSQHEWSVGNDLDSTEPIYDSRVLDEPGHPGQRWGAQDPTDDVEDPLPRQVEEEILDEGDDVQRWDGQDSSASYGPDATPPDTSEDEDVLQSCDDQQVGEQDPLDRPLDSDAVENLSLETSVGQSLHNYDDVSASEGISEFDFQRSETGTLSSEALTETQDSAVVPELPNDDATHQMPSQATLNVDARRAKALPPKNPRRKVPFRAIRKAFSRTTGIHGLITPSSMPHPTKRDKRLAKQESRSKGS
ncbi:hypothetical protein MHU86_25122 [Fragilaria crotonensis]|nr:hypothetical protein MHU86_25122 [Fragilaria crotonensis]